MKHFLLTCFLLLAWGAAARTPAADTIPKPVKVFPEREIPAIRAEKYDFIQGIDTCVTPGDRIAVKVRREDFGTARTHLKELRLWVNRYPFNSEPLFCDSASASIIFCLSADTSQAGGWWKVFYASMNYWNFHQKISVRLGTRDEQFEPLGRAPQLGVRVVNGWLFALGYLLFIVILLLVGYKAKGSLRDIGVYTRQGVKIGYGLPTNAATATIKLSDVPYSLSCVQFLFWMMLIFFSIIHIWVFRDIMPVPAGSVLFLLGISGTTLYAGKLIDTKQQQQGQAPDPTVVVANFIAQDLKSRGLINDCLNDGQSASLHRLQLLMFTALIGLYFLRNVLLNLQLPELSEEMLALMGISSITYAGVKASTEKKAAPGPTTQAQAPPADPEPAAAPVQP